MRRAALATGTRLGELEILRVLADGGFGIVYLARDHVLDRDVAVKEFMPGQLVERSAGQHVSVRAGTSAEAFGVGLRAFIEEAKLLASFSHPAIVKVHRFWEANGTGYMSMPYLHGPTLSDLRRSLSEPPTEAWLRSMIEPLLDALALLHSRGVCHRDVAPDNVVVTGTGRPVLLDFGAARRLIGEPARLVTAVVKPCYAPIEQYAEAARFQQGPWTDLYGVGALVAYLIDGQPPPAATARCVHDDRVPLAHRKIQGVSKRFLGAMDWALAIRPHDRPHNVAALRDALDGRSSLRLARWRYKAAAAKCRIVHALSPNLSRHPTGAASRWVPLVAAAAMVTLVAGSRATLEDAARFDSPPLVPRAVASVTPPAAVAAAQAALGDREHAQLKSEVVIDEQRPSVEVKEPRERNDAHRPHHRAVRRKAPVIDAVAAGPRELCAGRNFFVRPYCVHRLCGDPRYKNRSECVAAPRRDGD